MSRMAARKNRAIDEAIRAIPLEWFEAVARRSTGAIC